MTEGSGFYAWQGQEIFLWSLQKHPHLLSGAQTASYSIGPRGSEVAQELYTVVPPYLRVIRSKTYCGYVKPWIIPNAIYNMIFMYQT
jgi:hypothetical protein